MSPASRRNHQGLVSADRVRPRNASAVDQAAYILGGVLLLLAGTIGLLGLPSFGDKPGNPSQPSDQRFAKPGTCAAAIQPPADGPHSPRLDADRSLSKN